MREKGRHFFCGFAFSWCIYRAVLRLNKEFRSAAHGFALCFCINSELLGSSYCFYWLDIFNLDKKCAGNKKFIRFEAVKIVKIDQAA